MKAETVITSLAKLSELVDSRFGGDKSTTVIYRGHGAASFELRPKVGRLRPPEGSHSTSVNERLMLELFRRRSVDLLHVATTDDWELLAIAQHHGLATRLLDWTRSPLVALYFCVCKEVESREADGRPSCEDAELLAWRCRKEDLSKRLPKDPLSIKDTIRYMPRILTPRLRVQSGLFTVHPKPTQVFTPSNGKLMRFRVPHNDRSSLKKSLSRHGIHEAVLFPDLDGLARHIEWLQTSCY